MELEDYVAARGAALLRLAYLLTGDPHRAEDLAQATLTKALARWSRVIAADNPDAYIRKICVNQHLSWLRRFESRETLRAEPADRHVAGPDRYETVVVRDELRRALGTLTPRARAVIVLRYYEDLDDATIAVMLGVKPATVRSLAHRGLIALRPLVPDPAVESDQKERS